VRKRDVEKEFGPDIARQFAHVELLLDAALHKMRDMIRLAQDPTRLQHESEQRKAVLEDKLDEVLEGMTQLGKNVPR